MNDLSRASLDMEIERLHTKMAEIDALSEEYEKLLKRCDTLMKVANEDDKIQADAELEKQKLILDEDKQKENSKWQKLGLILQGSSTIVSALTTIACYIILIRSNETIQERSIMFEMDGYSHTDRSDKFIQKVPMPKI